MSALTSVTTIRDVLEKELGQLLKARLEELYDKIEYESQEKWVMGSRKLKEKFVKDANVFTLSILQRIDQHGLSVEFKI